MGTNASPVEPPLVAERPRVGAAIAVHNGREFLRRCLDSGSEQWAVAVVLDDGSTDGTQEMLRAEYPDTIVVQGDGEHWWTAGTNRAIEGCMSARCDYALLLNPDVVLFPDTVEQLLAAAQGSKDGVFASLVLNSGDPSKIWWAGSTWRRIAPWIPIMTSRYLYPSGTDVADLPVEPFPSDEAHGRAVLIPMALFERFGLFDEEHLPHYGADVDFSLRLRAAQVPIHIVPRARVTLEVDNSGHTATTTSVSERLRSIWRFLTDQKSGDAVRIWWHLTRRHAPLGTRNLTYTFILSLNILRRLGVRRRVPKR